MPVRVQRKRTRGWKQPKNTRYVGRGSTWGNKFVIGRDGTAQECVQKYIDDLLPYRHHGPNSELHIFLQSEAVITAIKTELKGYNLSCWCPLDAPCHADFLLKTANED